MPTSLRSDTGKIVRLADADLAKLWRMVAQGASAEVALRDLLPAIVTEYGALGGALAAEWYDGQRAKAGVKGRFTSTPIAADDRGSQALIGWALFEAKDDQTLQTLILGGVQRRIADHVRLTVMDSSVADPQAKGWERVGSGECDFCAMLIGRGAVYSEASADFASHDHCNCSAVPAFDGEPRPVKPYTPSLRQNPADQARAREYIASH
jgi:hypothetical protein